jgi:hypothetical protein
MKERLFCFISFSLLFYQGNAGNEFTCIGGRGNAMGNTAVASSETWSVFNNQAGLAWSREVSAGIYLENRYLLRETSLKAAAFAIPFKIGSFGLSVQHFGFSLYSEMKAGLAYARSFGTRFSAGLQLDYLRIQLAENYGKRNLVTCEVGIQFKATETLTIGTHFINPVPIRISKEYAGYLPTCMIMGLSWKVIRSLILAAEVEKNIKQKPSFKAGLEYHLVKHFCARLGVITNPTIITFGFGTEWGRFQVDLASSYHLVLGYSPQFSLIYKIKR